jgi:hypothetical protein
LEAGCEISKFGAKPQFLDKLLTRLKNLEAIKIDLFVTVCMLYIRFDTKLTKICFQPARFFVLGNLRILA